jgi:hemerythrin superfamily protein
MLEQAIGSTTMASKKRTGTSRPQNGQGRRTDAISLLKADHRQVEKLFSQFEKARDADRKEALAQEICDALKLHTKLEEEIFYPAFFEATGDTELHHEAEIEHANAKQMIAEIESSSARDDYYDARVSVLSEMIKHHVKEEEQPGGMFSEARKSDMDLTELGEQMKVRKDALEDSNGKGGGLRAVASRLLAT